MTLTTDQIIDAVMKRDVAEQQALLSELSSRIPRPDQAAFDLACVKLAKHREALMDPDPSRRRSLEQVLEAVGQRRAK